MGVLKKEKASEICVLGFETGGWVGDGEGGGGGRVFCVAEMGGGEGGGNGNGEGRNGNGGGNGGEVVNGGNGGGSNGGRSSRVGNGSVAMGGHHEGEWLLLGGYKAHEQALVMNLEGFDEVHMAKIELGMFSSFPFFLFSLAFRSFPLPSLLPSSAPFLLIT